MSDKIVTEIVTEIVTNDELQAIKNTLKRLEDWPWKAANRIVYLANGEEPNDHNIVCECWESDEAVFIAEARQNIPALVADVEELRALLAVYRDQAEAATGALNAERNRADVAEQELAQAQAEVDTLRNTTLSVTKLELAQRIKELEAEVRHQKGLVEIQVALRERGNELHAAQLAAVPIAHIATLAELALRSELRRVQLAGKVIAGWLIEWKVQP